MKTETVQVRLTPRLMARLSDYAKIEQLSMSEAVRELLRDGLNAAARFRLADSPISSALQPIRK